VRYFLRRIEETAEKRSRRPRKEKLIISNNVSRHDERRSRRENSRNAATLPDYLSFCAEKMEACE
jgi:hypothetical protein